MNKGLLLTVSVLLFVGLCCGQSLDDIMEDLSIELEFSTAQVPENLLEISMYTVYGSELDVFERMILDSLDSDAFSMQSQARVTAEGEISTKEIKINKKQLSDKEITFDELAKGTTVVILVGGRNHNRITDEVYAAGCIKNESIKYMGQLIIGKGELDNDSKLIVLQHKIIGEDIKLKREAVKYSPLKAFVPEAYIPVVATGIGILLMKLFTISKTVAEFLALDVGRKKKKFGHTGPHIKGIYLKETMAILGAASVLGFAVTWTFTGPDTTRFFKLMPLNMAICLFAALSHELSHRLVGKLFGIEIEYRFWYAGSFITILTAFFGNSFGIQGFLMERAKEDVSKWKYGVTKLAAPMVSAIITVIFAVLYLKNPNVTYQLIYTTASIWAMAEIIPVKGLDGYDIRNWNKIIWFIASTTITIIFFTVNFIQ